VKATGGYLVEWTRENATEEEPIVEQAVYESIYSLLNVSTTLDLALLTLQVDVVPNVTFVEDTHGTNETNETNEVENRRLQNFFESSEEVESRRLQNFESLEGLEEVQAVRILFNLEFPTFDVSMVIDELNSVFENRNHASPIEEALRNTGLASLSSVRILGFFMVIASGDNVTEANLSYRVPLGNDPIVPLEEFPLDILILLIALALVVCLICTFGIYCYRRSRTKQWEDTGATDSAGAGILPGQVEKSVSRVVVQEEAVVHEIEDSKGATPKSGTSALEVWEGVKDEMDDLAALGVDFASDSEEEGQSNEMQMIENRSSNSGWRRDLEDVGVIFQEDGLFETEAEALEREATEMSPRSVRLEVMDMTQEPPRIHGNSDRDDLRDAGIIFGTEASSWRSEVSETSDRFSI